MIPESFLEELKTRISIEEVISPYVPNLKRAGKTYKGLCPFHSERTASFTVYPDTQSFYCFGCGAGGDGITFIRNIENLDYVEAVKMVAEKVGLSVPESNSYDESLAEKKRRMRSLNREAAKFFYETLLSPAGKIAKDYLARRGFTTETIVKYGVGYAPKEWQALIDVMRAKGYSRAELVEANLARVSEKNGRKNYYDNFRERLMFPIIDVRGNVIAFGGRVLDDSKPKYINSSDTLIYKKSEGVFGLNTAKNHSKGKLILTEGYMDTIALYQSGFKNAIACLGTALTQQQALLIARYADEVILAYDADDAGQKATVRAIQLFSKTGIKTRVLRFSVGEDPDDYIRKHGAERFQALLDGAANDTEYKLLAARNGLLLETADGRSDYLKKASKILASIQNQMELEVYAGRLAKEMEISKPAIMMEVERLKKSARSRNRNDEFRQVKKDSKPKYDRKTGKTENIRAEKAERNLLATLWKNPDFLTKMDSIETADFVTDMNANIFMHLEKRIRADRSIDISAFSQELGAQEIGKIAYYQTVPVSNTIKEANDCIAVIKEEKENIKLAALNTADLSDDEYRELFKKK